MVMENVAVTGEHYTKFFVTLQPLYTCRMLQNISVQGVTERCGQSLDTSCTHQRKKNCPYQHVSGNI
jgi:hypothetical protein